MNNDRATPNTTPDNDPALGAALRSLRKDRGQTQEDLAYHAGITVAALARIERGQSNPRWVTVRRIAAALPVGLVELSAAVERATQMQTMPSSSR